MIVRYVWDTSIMICMVDTIQYCFIQFITDIFQFQMNPSRLPSPPPQIFNITDHSLKLIQKRRLFFRSHKHNKSLAKTTNNIPKLIPHHRQDFIVPIINPHMQQKKKKKKEMMGFRRSAQKSPYIKNMCDDRSLEKMMRLLVPVRGPNQSLKLAIRKHNRNNMKNAQLLITKKADNFEDRMRAYTTRMGLHQQTKIFVMNSRDTHIRQALLKRGWAQSTQKDSILFHLKWVYKDSPSDYLLLQGQQHYNHFKHNQSLTNKNQLQRHIKNAPLRKRPSFPISYDLGVNQDNIGFQGKFVEFQIVKAIGMVGGCVGEVYPEMEERLVRNKQLFMGGTSKIKKNGNGNSVCKNNCNLQLLYRYQVQDLKKDKTLWQQLSALYQLVSLAAQMITKALHIPYSIFNHISFHQDVFSLTKTLQSILIFNAQELLNKLSPFYLHQILKIHHRCLQLSKGYGAGNMWILKPSGVSRGSGIQITNDLSKINSFRHGKIIQKYIQNPLLLQCGRKFDIRQWVLVTSFQPLQAYVFKKCYARFSSQRYSNSQHGNLQKHLTNYAQNKETYMKSQLGFGGSNGFDSNLSSVMIQQQLQRQIGQRWRQIKKKMRKDILLTLNCCRQSIVNRQGCFQVYGFDILLDQYYQPYVLQVNMSPACQNRQGLGQYLQQMAEGLIDMFEGGNPTSWIKLLDQKDKQDIMDIVGKDKVLKSVVTIQRCWRNYISKYKKIKIF